jgi:hypothetical protein
VLGIIAAYLYFVNGKGQQWMRDRKPFELNGIINVYNVVQVFLNLYLGIGVRDGIAFRLHLLSLRHDCRLRGRWPTSRT